MKKYTFAYGSTHVEAEIDERNVMAVLQGNDVPPIDDIRAALYKALEEPVGCAKLTERLTPASRIALVVSDMSRFWMRQDLVIPHLTDYIEKECRVPRENITVVIANGTHTGGDETELRTILTDAVYERYTVVSHDCLADDLVYMGTTAHDTPVWINKAAAQADTVICLGACTHHVMAGFGGGRKSILPGISGMQTICHNHAYALDPDAFRSNPLIGNAVLNGNPLNEDMCEAVRLLPDTFMVNLVMNADMKLAAIYAGDAIQSWLKGCEAVDAIYSVPVDRRADVIIAGCGGYPKDMSLYQGTKTIDNIEPGLRKGGTLILIIEARDGGGPEEYFGWIKDLTEGTMEKRLREHFTVPGYIFLLNCEQARRYRVMMLTSVPKETLAPMGIEAYGDMNELLSHIDLNGKSIYVIPNGATVIPRVRGER